MDMKRNGERQSAPECACAGQVAVTNADPKRDRHEDDRGGRVGVEENELLKGSPAGKRKACGPQQAEPRIQQPLATERRQGKLEAANQAREYRYREPVIPYP